MRTLRTLRQGPRVSESLHMVVIRAVEQNKTKYVSVMTTYNQQGRPAKIYHSATTKLRWLHKTFHTESREKYISIQDIGRGTERGEWVHSGPPRLVY